VSSIKLLGVNYIHVFTMNITINESITVLYITDKDTHVFLVPQTQHYWLATAGCATHQWPRAVTWQRSPIVREFCAGRDICLFLF